jgi:NADPH-dependent ferric siderophore reductase
MQTYRATVADRRPLSAHLVRLTLALPELATTGVPDEYVRVLIAPEGAELSLPTIDEKFNVTYPEGAVEPISRVYTISDHRETAAGVEVDVDVALHDVGPGAAWARDCAIGSQVGIVEPHGLYAAGADVPWQLLVCDITGVPALARILRGLRPGQRAEAVVVLTDAADELDLPSPGDVTITWQVVQDERGVEEALTRAVVGRSLPETSGERYVWFAGEARASRAVRRHLRKVLGWPQSDFYTCGYWQFDAEAWHARYEQVAADIIARAQAAQAAAGDDTGAYLDALEDIYESAGL